MTAVQHCCIYKLNTITLTFFPQISLSSSSYIVNKFYSSNLCVFDSMSGLFCHFRYVQSFSELVEFQDEEETDEVSNRQCCY